MREQKANDNGFPVVGKQAKEQQIFPFDQLVEYDGATNKITINANLIINGNTNIGELDIDSGDALKGQVLTANGQSGASWGFPGMERIIDLNDNFRFVEGSGTNQQISGVTFTYSKFSLSGTHLMIVLAGQISNGSSLTNGQRLVLYELPQWVYNKIVPLFAQNNVDRKQVTFFADDFSVQNASFILEKIPNTTRIAITHIGSFTVTANRQFRIQFDLLIDAE